MRLLLDQGLPASTAQHLRAAHIDCVHVEEIGWHAAADAQILDRGRQEGRVVITLDADFHTILALTSADAPSVVRLRVEGLRGDALSKLILSVIVQCRADLEAGAALSVSLGQVRVHPLPLGGSPRTE